MRGTWAGKLVPAHRELPVVGGVGELGLGAALQTLMCSSGAPEAEDQAENMR